jgi:hypothetical protein
MKLEDRHGFSVLPACFRSCLGRKALSGGEIRLPMLKRWREKRKLIELAKLWATLDAAAPR